MKHTLPLSLALLLGSGLPLSAQASLVPLYQESVSGDLDGRQTLVLVTSGTVSGVISSSVLFGAGWQGHDSDAFYLVIPAGKQLTSITLDYTGTATVGSVRSGVSLDAWGLAYNERFDWQDFIYVGVDGIGSGTAAPFAQTALLPLTQADLFWPDRGLRFGLSYGHVNHGSAPPPVGTVGLAYQYTLSFGVEDVVASNVPEPSSAALLLLGLGALPAAAGRWCTRRSVDRA